MAYMASWGPMGFLVSPQKIIALENFTTSVTLKEDSENDTSGTPPTNTRGRQLIPMSFSETCHASAGVDPLARYSLWSSLIGNAYPLLIGGKRIGPARMKLKNVAMSDTAFTVSGDFIQATISITLEEWSEENTSALLEEETAETTSTGSTSSTGSTGGTVSTGGAGSTGSTGSTGSAGDASGAAGGTSGAGLLGALKFPLTVGTSSPYAFAASYSEKAENLNQSRTENMRALYYDENIKAAGEAAKKAAMNATMPTAERKEEIASAHHLLRLN